MIKYDNSNLYIRYGKPSDLEQYIKISKYSELFERHFKTEENLKKYIVSWIKNEYYFITCIDKITNIITGLCVLDKNGAFGDFPYIKYMIVDIEYRNLGIGTILLNYCDNFTKEILKKEKIFLFVDDFNPKAYALYHRNGYKKVGEIENLWTEGITDYLMIKSLTKED